MTEAPPLSELLTRTEDRLRPEASRTLCRLFVPGEETLIRGESREMVVIDRVLALSDDDVALTLARTLARFSAAHRDLTATLEHHFELVATGSADRSGPTGPDGS